MTTSGLSAPPERLAGAARCRAFCDAVLAASGIEAFQIAEGADLSSRGDTINA